MVCLPIPPLRLFENYFAFSGGAAGAASLFSVGAGVLGVASAGFSGAAPGAAAGVAGVVAFAGTTDRLPGLEATIVNASEVTMKIIAAAVVAFESNVAVPRWPNAV